MFSRSRERRAGRAGARRAFGLLVILSLVLTVVVGLAMFSKRVGAQPSRGGLVGALSVPNVMDLAVASPASAAVAAASPPVAPSAGRAESSDAGSPLDYASIQTDADFPPGGSDEEKRAVGTGKVPIHREGTFRSPFAHPRFGGAAKVSVGLVIVEVRDYNIQTGAFQAEFFLSLTSDKEMGSVNLAYTNGHETTSTTLADTPTFKLYRVGGSFTGPIDLRTYPFDSQALPIEVEDQSAGIDQIVLVPNLSRVALDEGFAVPGWNVARMAARSYKHRYPARFDRDDLYVSRYRFDLTLSRYGLSAALSVFVPAYVIVLIALTGYWVPPRELEVRSNTGAPMLAAAVLFHYALISSLPATGYLTRADKVMMATYVALLMNMFSTWLFLVVGEERMEATFRAMRWSFPILTAVIMAVGTLV